jgi:hypothetical protein
MEILRELCFQFRYKTSSVRQTALIAAAALYFVGGVRVTFSYGVGAGGPAAYWYHQRQ